MAPSTEPTRRRPHRIPNVVHFVFGLRPQTEPFHLLHHLAIESCRQVLRPEAIFLHHHELPYGMFWDLSRPHVTLVPVDPVPEVEGADYSDGRVPPDLRYAHHADFLRLDALIEHGGIYADIDTLFLRPILEELHERSFVIPREQDHLDERTGRPRPGLCNALMMAEPGAPFARLWRDRMAGALDGSWSNHSCALAHVLAEERPDLVTVAPERLFLPVPCSIEGLRSLLEEDGVDDDGVVSVHLWAHLWWAEERRDFSSFHAGEVTPEHLRTASTSLARLARPYVPQLELW